MILYTTYFKLFCKAIIEPIILTQQNKLSERCLEKWWAIINKNNCHVKCTRREERTGLVKVITDLISSWATILKLNIKIDSIITEEYYYRGILQSDNLSDIVLIFHKLLASHAEEDCSSSQYLQANINTEIKHQYYVDDLKTTWLPHCQQI